ncbi:alginate lyase family protein [Neolewinella persica]|uniref:alginate lyase family protein n=1 Tax=Neolewinella persica TaxID=70998 RepID=UPI00037992B3|nr:alginate lyase family protein [Neolewinella persica]
MRLLFIGLLGTALLFACGTEPPVSSVDDSAAEPLTAAGLTNLDLSTLLKVKAAIQAGDQQYLPAYEALLRDADTALADRLYAVTDKTTVPASGDKHDYLSLGPYWWPDTTKPDGLPWIRRDGEVNPMTRGNNVDEPSKDAAFDNINTLALAAFFSDEEKYAARALAQLNTWFLNPETRMNPNLNFGQGIPGINTGRGIGIIETIALGSAVTGMELLELNKQLPDEAATELNEWLTAFVDWLMTSEMGIAEREWHNNHGSWYDVQVVVLLRHLGREEEARKILETAREKRITAHLAADGSQPHELERTKSLTYSIMNLRSLTRLAYHGQQLGVDLWNYRPAHGAGLTEAYAYLKPYAFTDKEWAYEQLGSMDNAKAKARHLFYETGAIMDISEFCELVTGEDLNTTDRSLLLYHCPSS